MAFDHLELVFACCRLSVLHLTENRPSSMGFTQYLWFAFFVIKSIKERGY